MQLQRLSRAVLAALLVVPFCALPRAVSADVPTGTPVFSDPLDIDNGYLPFREHRIRLYEQVRGVGDLHVIDIFRSDTRTFTWNGDEVECRELEEWEVADGEIVEISWNYFAQADDGTVWYFGEVVDKYEGGEVVGHGGSWLVGGPSGDDPAETVTASTPTVFMPANPEVGDRWKAEDLPADGIEEFDLAQRILRRLETPYGTFRSVLQVEERTPDVGTKWYAPQVGFVRQRSSDGEVVALIEIEDAEDAEETQEELDEIVEELLGLDD